MTTPTPQSNLVRLKKALVRGTPQADIILALGVVDAPSLGEEFWRIQAFTAQYRFFLLCRQELGMDLAAQVDECDEPSALQLALKAEALIESGLTYESVRSWFLARGKFEQALAYKLRHEQERMAELTLRVLLVFNKGAKWLAFGPTREDMRLVDKVEDAHHFPVTSPSEMSKDFLKNYVARFEYAKALFEAKEVKVLCGRNPANPLK